MDLQQIDRMTRTALEYYKQPECIPTPENFRLWIDSLREPMKSNHKAKGFEKSKGVLNYKRFILELADIGMTKYMRDHLSAEDFEVWEASARDPGE